MSDPHTNQNLETLIQQYAYGAINAEQLDELEAVLKSDPDARRRFLSEMNLHSTLDDLALSLDSDDSTISSIDIANHSSLVQSRRTKRTNLLALLAVCLLVVASLVPFMKPQQEQRVALISGMSGSLQWTGDGGRVSRNVEVGDELSGGTIEGMTPESWFELTFEDGSTVSISGHSMLTYADNGQKVLHLKSGSFSANVAKQSPQKPMLIHTRSALFEVLGTRLNVDADLSSSTLTVTEGRVRATRRSDGESVEVPAQHRVIASIERELRPEKLPESVSQWGSQLYHGPTTTYGKWIAGSEDLPARLWAIPYTADKETGRDITLYTASVGVSTGETPPVVLPPQSKIRIRGRLDHPNHVFFGLTVRHRNGDFAGRFQTILPAESFTGKNEFEVILNLDDYSLDPSLEFLKEKLPKGPAELIVESVWCHTLFDQAGLAITSVELNP
ncbi:FecR family protein [Planctomicrobium sp.]|jgi:ferric-dicitrate binding protein FerR (iron transport regulator)|nr:FecR family protein [Planctomicrobium sp.]MBT5019347.1 FecR domain-containing protein [Planctomicrobium sp.]MDB4733005.1 FecR family protein [Planctomicrobium sp.]